MWNSACEAPCSRRVPSARRREHHVEEVGGEAELRVRVDDGLAHRRLVGDRRDRRHLRDEADGGEPALVGVVDVDRVGVEGGEGADDADLRVRMRGVRELRRVAPRIAPNFRAIIARTMIAIGWASDLKPW